MSCAAVADEQLSIRGRAAFTFGLAATTLSGLILRAWRLTERSLWHDEAFSWRLTQFPLDETLRRVALDVHPPLHFLLLKGWIGLFGDSVLAMRGLSVLLGIATILGIYLFCVEAFGRRASGFDDCNSEEKSESKNPIRDAVGTSAIRAGQTCAIRAARHIGLLAAALVAVSIFHIHWSTMARMYTLGTVLVAFSSWALFRALRCCRTLDWLLYSTFTLGLAYTHYYGLFSIAAQFLFLACWLLVRHRGKLSGVVRDRIFVGVTGSAMIVVVGFTPWIPVLLAQRAQVQEDYWTQDVRPHDVAFACYEMFVEPAGAGYEATSSIAAAVLVGGLLLLLLIRPERADWYVFLLAVTPFALSILVSKVDTKIFHPRYFLFAHLFILAGIARLVRRISLRFLRAAMAALLIGNGLGVTLWYYEKLNLANSPGARGAAEFVEQHRRCDDLVIVCSPLSYLPLFYHSGGECWYCYDRGKERILHYQGAAAFTNDQLITAAMLRKRASRHVWIIDSGHAKWGYPLVVPLSSEWQHVRTDSFGEVNWMHGSYHVRKYRKVTTSEQ